MSGELQRLAAQAEVAPIFRTHGGLVQSREGKELQRDLRGLARRGVRAEAEVAVHTSVAKVAMDGIAEVDGYRRLKAGGDELTNQLLAQVEIEYTAEVCQSQRSVRGNIYGI